MKWAQKQTGFTIVELLIVVVIIAILAAITIVAYSGVQNRAKESAMAAALSSALKKVELAKAGGDGQYPLAAADLGLPVDKEIEYTYETNSNRSAYCLAIKKGTTLISSANGGTAVPGGCASVTAGALGWWPLNGDGTDRSGNGRPLEVLAGMSPGVGQNGSTANSMAFSGSIQPRIAEIQLGGTSFTVSGWMNVSTFNNNGSYRQAPILGARSSAPGVYSAMHFGVRAGDTTNNPRIYMDYYSAGQAGSTLVNTGAWYHYAYTYNISNNARRFYLNGTLDGFTTVGAGYKGIVDTVGANCCMSSLQGRLDDVRVYNRVLSDSEIADMYASGAL